MSASANTQSVFSNAYNSFGGCDIKATFGNKVLAELQAISYSVNREKAPVYTMGSANPRSFSRGKRGIAGTLVVILFDRSALLHHMGFMNPANDSQADLKFLSDIDDLRPDVTSTAFLSSTASDLINGGGGSTVTPGTTVDQQETSLTSVSSDQAWALPFYADQIMPFDITMAAANEYGKLAVMRIYGAEFLNEGYGVSVDDLQSATQHTYIARHVVGWRSAGDAPRT